MFSIKIERDIVVQTAIAACLSLGEMINGYGTAWSAPILPILDDPNKSPLPYAITEGQKSWIASVIFFGCAGFSFGLYPLVHRYGMLKIIMKMGMNVIFTGTYVGGYLSNLVGRKKTLIITGFVDIITYILLSTAQNLVTMYFARLFVGLSISSLAVVGMNYLGEIASPNIRGIFMTTLGVFHALGSLMVYCVGPYLSYAGTSYVVIGLLVVYVGACCFLPESPVYYVLKDDEASARKVLEYLGRSTDVNTELKIMMEKTRQRQSENHIFRELFSLRSNRKSLFITVCLSSFQCSCGILTIIFYATTIFKLAGSSVKPELATIITGVMFVLGTAVTVMCIEKYGRRILLLLSTAGCCITMTLLGVYFYLRETTPQSVESLGWLPLALLIFAQLSYCVGLVIIPDSLCGELFTPKVRALGPAITRTAASISGLTSTTLFGPLTAAAGVHAPFWLFAVVNGLAFVFTALFVPETRGKSLVEIEEMLNR